MKASKLLSLTASTLLFGALIAGCSSKSKDVTTTDPAMTPSQTMASTPSTASSPKVAENSANLGAASSGNGR